MEMLYLTEGQAKRAEEMAESVEFVGTVRKETTRKRTMEMETAVLWEVQRVGLSCQSELKQAEDGLPVDWRAAELSLGLFLAVPL